MSTRCRHCLNRSALRSLAAPAMNCHVTVVNERPYIADYELVRRMRAGFCVLGPLLARRGKACVSLPGGCNIGDRPIDLHLKGLRALGAEIRIERGYVVARAARLRGTHIYLGGPFGSTVTGTCNVMVAAALAEGVTTIEAGACEPEVVDLGNLLNAMGARISGLGTPTLRHRRRRTAVRRHASRHSRPDRSSHADDGGRDHPRKRHAHECLPRAHDGHSGKASRDRFADRRR